MKFENRIYLPFLGTTAIFYVHFRVSALNRIDFCDCQFIGLIRIRLIENTTLFLKMFLSTLNKIQ